MLGNNANRGTSIYSIRELLGGTPKIVSLWDMLKNYASEFVWLEKYLGLLPQVAEKLSKASELNAIDGAEIEEQVQSMLDSLEHLKPILTSLGMHQSLLLCEEAIKMVEDFGRSVGGRDSEVSCQIGLLNKIIKNELGDQQFFYVRPDLVRYYNEMQFPHEAVERFPSALYDMEESGKCFALSRHTACASHLMRVMEAGIKELKSSLGIQAHTPTWDALIQKIRDYSNGLEKKTNAPQMKKLEEIVSRSYAIKDAWRNPTQHVERQYTEEEAKEVMEASKNFMRIISEYLVAYHSSSEAP